MSTRRAFLLGAVLGVGLLAAVGPVSAASSSSARPQAITVPIPQQGQVGLLVFDIPISARARSTAANFYGITASPPVKSGLPAHLAYIGALVARAGRPHDVNAILLVVNPLSRNPLRLPAAIKSAPVLTVPLGGPIAARPRREGLYDTEAFVAQPATKCFGLDTNLIGNGGAFRAVTTSVSSERISSERMRISRDKR